MLKEGKIVLLNNKEYIVINRMNLHNTNYVFLISNSKPLEIVIGSEKEKDGKTVLEEIHDNNELDYVLSELVLSNDNKGFDE